MTDDIRKTAIEELRRDAAIIDRAADVLYRRGALNLAKQVRKRVEEWMEQSDEMERRGA